MGPGDLKQTICGLTPSDERILVGFDTSEDASVYQINEDQAIVQTLDFITPVVDDPYIYGQIAAANALSDVFAMGADVKTAMNIVGFDKKNISKEALGLILKGGNEKIKECGGVLLGGHTIESPEMYYGLSVTGMIHPNKIIRNNTSKIGHVLVLTKPLGMGILTTAIKRDLLPLDLIKDCAKIMASLNYLPSKIMRKYEVSSCTDITGFGLMGHALECTNNLVTFSISCKIVFASSLSDILISVGISFNGLIHSESSCNKDKFKAYSIFISLGKFNFNLFKLTCNIKKSSSFII